jgi:hypothetical protein
MLRGSFHKLASPGNDLGIASAVLSAECKDVHISFAVALDRLVYSGQRHLFGRESP